MLERLTLPDTHAISITLRDPDTVKGLFDRFEKSRDGCPALEHHYRGGHGAENSRRH